MIIDAFLLLFGIVLAYQARRLNKKPSKLSKS